MTKAYYISFNDLNALKAALPHLYFADIHINESNGEQENEAYVDMWASIVTATLTEKEAAHLSTLPCVSSITARWHERLEPLIQYAMETAPIVQGANGAGQDGNRQTFTYSWGAVVQHIRNYGQYRIVSGTMRNSSEDYLNISSLKEKGLTGAGVKVGVIDNGYVMGDANNPQDFIVHGSYNSLQPLGVENMKGTHAHMVGGIIVANSERFEGIAPNAQLYFANINNTAASISWLVQQGCSIIVIPYYNYGARQQAYLMAAIKKAVDDGVIIVVPTGNNNILVGDGQKMNPLSTINGVVSVRDFKGGDYEAYDNTQYHYLPLEETYNKVVDFAVPARSFSVMRVDSTTYNNETNINKPPIGQWYTNSVGTSFCAPTVAGILALLKEQSPNLHGRVLVQKLKNTSKDTINNIHIPKQ